jgi:carboxyl-terminal processing protease
VTVTFGKEGEEPRELTIKRERIDLDSVTDIEIVEDGIGYIKLTDFRDGTVGELGKAIDRLRGEGMQSLILDLRNNPGGLLNSAVEVADRFVPDGKVIVSTRGRKQNQNIEKIGEDGFPRSTLPLAVLVNEYSASASEIVAGALQDWNCAIVIGEKTYGKGSVQNLIPLRDGSALRLTTARYYSPKGKVIDKVGITPDIVVEPVVEKSEEEKAGKEKGKEDKKKDPQIAQAVNILKSFEILK